MKFDDEFLSEVGLSNLPPEQKETFLKQVQEELELRVGEKMSRGLSDAQIEEFEGIMKNDQQVIKKVVAELGSDFREDPIYQKLLERNNLTEGTWEVIGEYLSIKWIQKNRPDYHDIVKSTIEELKAELKADSSKILNA
ncbi:hypothetical protein IJG91_00485 [Candidatus Saccharibacteria bacterium]|nr:hypothetical protein [Candidatus Saccharibacteria bacterium]